MGAEILVTLPARGDGRRGDWPRRPSPHVPADGELPAFLTDPRRGGTYGAFDHLAEVGRAVEIAGLDGALAPFDPAGEESLVVAAGLLRHSRWLRAVAEFHPGAATPVYAAKVAASLQRFSGERLGWRLAVDLDPATARAHGDFLTGPDRYARAGEFLTVAKGVWHEEGYTYEGRFSHVLAGGFAPPLAGRAFPRIYLSGTSPEALDLSAAHADVHVFGPDEDIDRAVAGLQACGRDPGYGLALSVLAREDDAEAWDAATAAPVPIDLVGSYETVAAALRVHIARGIGTFFLEARPSLEETYRIGEHLLPLLAEERPTREDAREGVREDTREGTRQKETARVD